MNTKDNKILYSILGAILLLVVIALGTYAYLTMQNKDNDKTPSNPDTSKVTPDDTDTKTTETPADAEQVDSSSYQSEKGVAITVTSPVRGATLTSPLTVKGSVPGTWSHEGQFTLRLLDASSTVLASGTATMDGDWMTESPVPFTAELTFTSPAPGSIGLLVLEKANPSGMEDGADSLTVAVQF